MRLRARFFFFVALFLNAVIAQVQSQNAATCRSLAMDCLLECISSATGAGPENTKECKKTCMNMYECSLSRDVWTQAQSDWCCACQGQRCPGE